MNMISGWVQLWRMIWKNWAIIFCATVHTFWHSLFIDHLQEKSTCWNNISFETIFPKWINKWKIIRNLKKFKDIFQSYFPFADYLVPTFWCLLLFDFLMNGPNSSLQICLMCKLMTTLTRLFDFLMDRLNMSLQMSLSCSLILTQITRISQWQWAQFYFLIRLHPSIRHMKNVCRKMSIISILLT